MEIIRVEDPSTSGVTVCENCGKETPGRRIEAIDTFHRGGRGWFFLCYECFGPRVFWRTSWNSSKVYESPVR